MIAIVDYGVGNLFSLISSLHYLGLECIVTNKKEDLIAADRIILPGVGAFGDAIAKLDETGLVNTIKKLAGIKPLLGICLGMQLLFEKSFEFGEHEGLGLIPGKIVPLKADTDSRLKIPHMGWNRLEIVKDDPIFKYFSNGEWVYYVHSYYAKYCRENILGISEYGVMVPGLVRAGLVYGAQFHPEKSGDAGLRLLKAFAEV
ncbi:imidazole glycerol phosphate synthase, glutamine amidotransferase subunit [Thermoclostridium stercorarium subsp. leptospartum DSM 9219]|uniref:Imidazole glycerol phosphate synthase subunit HisH n=1 Tax=Thermoclostridium stercorarium subsp. leptospartum DSM 9219 TaxID=1346611 RepID=A0A1B1YLR5_THEST|nr:imidazole glycerol phosphate synthase subunit HisH [Thermoclostridium stercorarium]ANX01683.1 imidazole glycerol phosphate synthase, glutamine amidotransferase subunit [Thermoclostridium stercorarium subsp. leptospartum DSM 9219]